jgi:hypothetical protein
MVFTTISESYTATAFLKTPSSGALKKTLSPYWGRGLRKG